VGWERRSSLNLSEFKRLTGETVRSTVRRDIAEMGMGIMASCSRRVIYFADITIRLIRRGHNRQTSGVKEHYASFPPHNVPYAKQRRGRHARHVPLTCVCNGDLTTTKAALTREYSSDKDREEK
jgi:hypothetical protein